MTWPAVVLWICIFGGLWSSGPALLYVFAVSQSFGTLQMLPGESLGGVNILPQSVCAAVLVAKIVLQRGNIVRGLATAFDPGRAGLLMAFLNYSVLTALLLPRIFAGQVDVVPISGAIVSGTSVLAPAPGNVTQTAYVILSTVTVLAISVVGTRQEFQRHFILSLWVGGVVLVLTGWLDLVSSSLGLSALLDPFRNASYTLLIDNEVLGAKRIVGLMPEASSYGSGCVTAAATLTLLRPCFEPRFRQIWVPLTIIGLLLMSALSTSSSAYIGLVIFVLAFGLNWMLRSLNPRALERGDLSIELAIVLGGAFMLLCAVVLSPALLDPINAMLNAMLFQKASSESYMERSMWTAVGWHAFVATQGLGVGLGGLRTSNWFVSILGNTGVFGACLLFGFVLRLMIVRPGRDTAYRAEMRRALRLSLLPSLVMAWFSGTIPDFGVAEGAVFGMLVALTNREIEADPSEVVPVSGFAGPARSFPLADEPDRAGALGLSG